MIDIKNIINEEVNEWLDESLNISREPFPFEQKNSKRYEFIVDIPEKNYKKPYEVTFHDIGGETETGYSIAFDVIGGSSSYDDTNLGEPMRIMATVSNIVKDFVEKNQPDILTFSPTRSKGDRKAGRDPNSNRRLDLYKYFVEKGAGGEYDGYVIGNKDRMSVEKTNGGFDTINGQQPAATIQNIIKDLSLYRGKYITPDLSPNDPNYIEYSAGDWGGFVKRTGARNIERTLSARRFVDWLMSEDDVQYDDGKVQQGDAPQTSAPVDAPIRRIGATHNVGTAEAGTFQHFLNNNIYGHPDYRELQPFFDTLKTEEKFDELKLKIEQQLWTAEESEKERLQGIIDAIISMKRAYEGYGNSQNTNTALNEIEDNLNDLLK